MVAVKLIPHLLSWVGIVLVLLRGFSGRRSEVMAASISGLVIGVTGTAVLLRAFSATIPYSVIKSVLGVCFLLFWGISVAAIYRSTGRSESVFRGERFFRSSLCAGVISGLAAMIAGAVCSFKLPAAGSSAIIIVLLALGSTSLAYALVYAALIVERRLSASFKVAPLGMLAAVVSLLLFSSSSLSRLDLFSPLSMKVMKGVHDFVHQFMESILIPDHLFVRPVVWEYIGFLFGKEVGFWGGMVIWFTPALLIALAVGSVRPPSVAHIRQGAQRRKLLSGALRNQRLQLLMPLLSMMIFAAAAYQSSFPSVEYWDPKPLPVTANQAGEIIIPKGGDINLEDGKLHKYVFKHAEREARFFVLLTPEGKLTVDLDACAICKPDGYGQAEGSVICYYCKTLIPLETVGKPGGCNPVPVAFSLKNDSVVIDGITLMNSWTSTVQATARVKEGSK
jgi:hypothetical protein